MLHQLNVFLCVLFTGCGSAQVDLKEQPEHVDVELTPYVDSFRARYCKQTRCSRVESIRLGNVQGYVDDNQVVGICNVQRRWGRRVAQTVIDPVYWSTIGELEKTVLIWHELGHCYLNMEYHNPDGFMGEFILNVKSEQELIKEADKAFNH
jgi:hypothetical protein